MFKAKLRNNIKQYNLFSILIISSLCLVSLFKILVNLQLKQLKEITNKMNLSKVYSFIIYFV